MASVRSFASDFRRRFDRLDLLVNNAGVGMPPQQYCADGFEMHFGVNHIGHFLLTALLMNSLKKSSAARIVTVSSLTHRAAHIDFDHIVKGIHHSWLRYEWLAPVRSFYIFAIHYGWSKLANLLFTYELSRRLQAAKITSVISVAAHPGLSYTPIHDKGVRTVFPRFLWRFLIWLIGKLPVQSADMGALPILHAATANGVKTGEYFGPDRMWGLCGHPKKEQSAPQSHSEEDAARLWTLSEKLTRHRFQLE